MALCKRKTRIQIIRIGHFTVVYLVTWPWMVSEAGGDLVLIQTSLLFICKWKLISLRTAWSTHEKQWGLYQNKVNPSLAYNPRPGHLAHLSTLHCSRIKVCNSYTDQKTEKKKKKRKHVAQFTLRVNVPNVLWLQDLLCSRSNYQNWR